MLDKETLEKKRADMVQKRDAFKDAARLELAMYEGGIITLTGLIQELEKQAEPAELAVEEETPKDA